MSVSIEAGSLFSNDYQVAFNEQAARYEAWFTPAGLFPAAIRFIERWIARHAARLDDAYVEPPSDHEDWGEEPLFWMVERNFDEFLADMRAMLEANIAQMERIRPITEAYSGDIPPEKRYHRMDYRMRLLQDIENHFADRREEVEFDEFLADMRAMIKSEITQLERVRPGTTRIEYRVQALQTMLKHFTDMRAEVETAVLSPHTAAFLRSTECLPKKPEESSPSTET